MSNKDEIDYNPNKLTEADRCSMYVREFRSDVGIESGDVTLRAEYSGNGVYAHMPPEKARKLAFDLLAAAADCDGRRDLISEKELIGILDHAARIHQDSIDRHQCDKDTRPMTRVTRLLEATVRREALRELRDMITSAVLEKR